MLHVSVKGYSQFVSLSERNAKLESVFKKIESQTGYFFFYESKQLRDAKKIDINVQNAPLKQVLDLCLSNLPLTYEIIGKTVVVKDKAPADKKMEVPEGNIRESFPLIKITGKVKDEKGNPLLGASVKLKGATNGTSTDNEGNFVLNIPDKCGGARVGVTSLQQVAGGQKTDTNSKGSFELNLPAKNKLQITMVGYKPVIIDADSNMVIKMDIEIAALEEVVTIGYTQQKKELLTGAVSNVKVSQAMEETPTPSAADLLVGRAAGVYVNTAPGRPGTQNSISVRTGSSWNSQPVLYVIDGMVRDAATFQNLSPIEIESMTVLKDAASSALYGVRSDGGVVVVTTRRGQAGAIPTINYGFNYSADQPTQQVPLTNLYEYGLLANQMYANANSIDPRIPAAAPQGNAWSQPELDWAKALPGQGYDALKALWETPYIMTTGLTVSGGSDKIKYFGVINLFNQSGFLKSTDYRKLNARLNFTADITSNLQLYAGFAFTNAYTASAPMEGTDATYTKLRASFNYMPVMSSQGDRYLTTGWAYGNASAEADGLIGYQHNNYIDPQANVSLTYKIPCVRGLSVKASYMANWSNNHYKEYDAHATFWFPVFTGDNNHIVNANDASLTNTFTNTNFWGLYSTAGWQSNSQLNLQASYNRSFGNHRIDAALVFERAESNFSSINNQAQGFPVYQTDQYWATNRDHNNAWAGGGPDYKTGRAAYIGQVNYSYGEKYLLNLSVREDGSMYFAPGKRWGVFPAASAGWIVSHENFFRSNKTITNLKLRASIGLAGNDAVVSGWQWQQSYATGSTYYLGNPNGSAMPGIRYGSLVNPNLTWEKSLSYNLGADFEFVKHLSVTVDYWFKHTYDILGSRQNSLPTTFSLTMPQENYGIINAQGFELMLGWHDRAGAINWFANLNASYGWNKVIKKDFASSSLPWQIPVGKTTNYIAGYTADIIRTASQLADWKKENPNYVNPTGSSAIGLGSMVYSDASGPQNKPDGVINNYDQSVLYANPNPVVYGVELGANWKGFSIEALLTGLIHNPKNFYELADYYDGQIQMINKNWIDKGWTPANPDAPLPMSVPRSYRSYSISNANFWYKDASFIRLKNLNIAYTFNFHKALGNAIRSIRIYTAATNLFYISKFKYWDPELNPGWSGIGYPIMRTISGGIDVKF
jgi:TonB-linked SusC/RagA family outer membrane protein